MHRFFVSPDLLAQDELALEGDLAHQISRVLRLCPGDEVILLDGLGWAYPTAIDHVSPRLVRAHVSGRWRPESEPRLPIIIHQALAKGRRFEWALQKSVELGATTIVPMLTERGVSRPDDSDRGKLDRWRRIAQEAAEQSGRAVIPQVAPVSGFREACRPPGDGAVSLMACLAPTAQAPSEALASLEEPAPTAVRLYVGPEGGFSPDEIAGAAEAGIVLVSLGPRVLRTETAAVALLSLVMYALGELERGIERPA